MTHETSSGAPQVDCRSCDPLLRLRQIAEMSSDWFWEMDADLRFTYLSERFAEVTGIDPALVIGKRREDLAADTTAGPEWTAFRDATASRRPFRRFTYEMLGADGRRLVIRVSGVPLFDNHRQFSGYRGTGTDITAERRALDDLRSAHDELSRTVAALRESEARFRSLADNAPGIIFQRVLHRDGRVTFPYASSGAKRQYGEDPSAATDYSSLTRRVIHPDDIERVRAAYAASAADLGDLHLEARVRRPDGAYRVCHVSARPRRGADETIVWDGIIVDRTEIHDAAAEREHLREHRQRLEGLEGLATLAGGMAHEVNNALTPVLAIANLLLAGAPKDSELAKDLSIIVAATRNARATVRFLLDARGGEPPDRRPFDPRVVVERAAALFRKSTGTVIDARIAAGAGAMQVTGNKTRVLQAVINLLNNARDALPEGRGDIRIEVAGPVPAAAAPLKGSAARAAAYCRITVADTGIGMDEETKRRIFEPFFTTKPIGKGTGLGMSVVWDAVRQHGGVIDLASAPGKGTRFDVFLPLDDPPPQTAVGGGAETPPPENQET